MIKILKSKKIIAFVLVIALASAVLMSSCGGGVKAGNPVMRAIQGGTERSMSSNVFSYYLSALKTIELAQYAQYAQMMGMESMPDTPELWNQPYTIESDPSIQTYGDTIRLRAVMQVQQVFAVDLYCRDNNISLSKDLLNNIDLAIKELIKNNYNNSKLSFNTTLARFGLNEQIYREIKQLEMLNALFAEYLISPTTGIKPVSDTAIWNKFTDNYVRVRHILIKTDPGDWDEEGKPVEYSEEELAGRVAKANDIYNKILGGEDFDDYYEESEDPGSAAYPNGYCFSQNGMFVPEFESAAFDMKIGEVRMVETDYGMHIMKKYELVVEDILEHEEDIIRELNYEVMMSELLPYINSIELINDEINEFSVVTADTMMDCLELIMP